jgi:aminopeptidase N
MNRYSLFVAGAVCLALAASAHGEAPFDFDQTPGKLPKTVVPVAYTIDITPDLEKLTLTGHETIRIKVRSATDTIVLNQAGLTIASATLGDGAAAAVTLDEAAQTATLTFPRALPAGDETLQLVYSGPIPATPAGIYYDDYKTAAGAAKRMLVTQFEVADARRMFPGWDEPAFKATFQLTATLPTALAAVSNMPIDSTTPAGPGLQRVAFKTSPRMSSYLLALIAGDMKAVSGQAAGVAMNAWAPSGRQDEARYSLEVEQQVLPYYNDYFGVAFPLPKLDLIAIPGNYEAGAMENWGAITFIDNDMLFDPATSSPQTRESIFLVVAHEMAHQWSGDLVTTAWWNNVWLNEGFATWMENKATDHFNPAWQIWPRQHSDRETAMGQDAMPTTRPIQQVIRDETEANSAFDGISYQKGGQVLRMVEDWIGPDVFRDGMRRYMKAHAYSSATSADFWAAMSAASGRDVAAVASGFTEQPGVPLVHVARRCDGGQARITLTQDRFTLHYPNAKAETWTIPVTLGGPGAATQRVLLGPTPQTLPIAGCETPVKVNLGESGYYRTAYDAASLAALGKVLPRLDAVDRANLLGDQYALFGSGRASLASYLDLLTGLKSEENIAVWTDTLNHLEELDTALRGSPERAAFDAYATALIKPESSRLGWDARPGESILDTILRPLMIKGLGQFDDAETLATAERRFHSFLTDPAALPPALRDAVLGIVGHHADAATWQALRDLGVKATSTEEKLRYFNAMAGAANPALMERNVVFANSGEIPNGRVMRFIRRASTDSGEADTLYRLIGPHESELAARGPVGGYGQTPLMAAAQGSFNPDTARALLAAPSSTASTGARVEAARIADTIDGNADLRARASAAVKAWLAARTNSR